jgi:hypothetical protein
MLVAVFLKMREPASIRQAETKQVVPPPTIYIIVTQFRTSCGANILKLPDFLNIFSGKDTIKAFVRRQPK